MYQLQIREILVATTSKALISRPPYKLANSDRTFVRKKCDLSPFHRWRTEAFTQHSTAKLGIEAKYLQFMGSDHRLHFDQLFLSQVLFWGSRGHTPGNRIILVFSCQILSLFLKTNSSAL